MLLSVHSASATPSSAVNTQQNLKECSNRQIAFGWLFKPRAARASNGMMLREPIIAVDDGARRLVWSAEGGPFTHYNASLQVFAEKEGSLHAWFGLLISYQTRSPAIRIQ